MVKPKTIRQPWIQWSLRKKAGLVQIELIKADDIVTGARLASPQDLILGETVSAEKIAEACMLTTADIKTETHMPLTASCGIPFILAEVASREALAAASPNSDAFRKFLPTELAVGIHLYVQHKDDDVDIHTRMFAPMQGIPEDPATGSANVALIGLLAHLENISVGNQITKTIAQGFDMGRPSLMQATSEKRNTSGGIATYIGGQCVGVMQGHIDLVQ
jgi:trans-2,3-dihydro-3-hydroxyanthranilate isomerase